MATKEEALYSVKLDGLKLQYLSNAFRKDRDIVLAAVMQNWAALRFASNSLKDDTDLVLTAVRKSIRARFHASHRLFKDASVIFVYNYNNLIPDSDWPIIKRALLEKPDYFLNPEPAIEALTEDLEYPYLMLAQYALGKDMNILVSTYPDIEF